MGIGAEIAQHWDAALAALAWQVDAGVDEVLADTPVNRYDLPEAQPAPRPAAPPAAPTRGASVRQAPAASAPEAAAVDPVAVATVAAAAARNLDELREAVATFDLCDLKKGARNTVFSDGNPASRLLILGEAPGRDEDIAGRPFVGRAGQLLDRMLAAIGLSRSSPDAEAALYITNVMPWRPEGNRDPTPSEIAMMKPFVERHIELVDPQVIVVMGNTPLTCLTGQRGILRARGSWTTALNRPRLPMTHPAYLLRTPIAKREAWADLLAVRERLRG